jgi:hypothetical protein
VPLTALYRTVHSMRPKRHCDATKSTIVRGSVLTPNQWPMAMCTMRFLGVSAKARCQAAASISHPADVQRAGFSVLALADGAEKYAVRFTVSVSDWTTAASVSLGSDSRSLDRRMSQGKLRTRRLYADAG